MKVKNRLVVWPQNASKSIGCLPWWSEAQYCYSGSREHPSHVLLTQEKNSKFEVPFLLNMDHFRTIIKSKIVGGTIVSWGLWGHLFSLKFWRSEILNESMECWQGWFIIEALAENPFLAFSRGCLHPWFGSLHLLAFSLPASVVTSLSPVCHSRTPLLPSKVTFTGSRG